MKIIFAAFFFSLTLCINNTVFSQSDLQKMLNSAKAIQKSAPQKNNPGQPGLPSAYENSWKVLASLTRTMTVTTDLTSKTSSKCKPTKKGSYQLRVNAEFSSDQALGWTNEDDFSLITDVDAQLRPFMHPFKGSYTGTSSGSMVETNCGDLTNTQTAVNGKVDLGALYFSFSYNRKKKQGSFTINPQGNYTAEATGKLTFSGQGGSGALNTSDAAKAEFNLMFGECSVFAGFNYPVAKDANTQQILASSPLTGGLASIGETKYGYDLSYSQSKTIQNVPAGWTGTSEVTYTTQVHIIITNESPPRLEAIIDPEDMTAYKNFIPKGPKIDGSETEGNSLAFRVRIIDSKDGGKDVTNAHPFTVTYTLDKVSNYKGICMNYPKQNADDKPDLRWSKLSLAETHLKSSTESTLTSKQREGSELSAFISCYDFAAYGILKVHVHLEDDGIDLEAHPKDKPEEFFATIPLDENHNKIADKWEKDVGTYNKTSDPDFDEDALPKKQRRDGDGYTLFEEYRGFKVKDNVLPGGSHEVFENGHLRMDPGYKDIFIDDENGLFKTYYEPYNPSDLCWHYIDKTEMIFTASSKDPQNRWTNFNKVPDHFYANQYALIFADIQAQSASLNCNSLTIGEQIDYDKVTDYQTGSETGTPGEESPGGYFDQAVKHTSIIYIYSGNITYCLKNNFKPDEAQRIYQESLIGTTIHEIGHALGITHHHPSPDIGVLNCSMRYASQTETSHRAISSARHYYCHKEDSWKELVNTQPDPGYPGKAVPLQTLTHPSDNCYGKIDVKSDP